MNAANYRYLQLIAEFARRAGWSDGRLQSCAHWLNFKVQEAAALSLEARQQTGRTLHYWYDADGSLVLKARLPALAGALLETALAPGTAS